jgi:hypothetical protein
MTESSQHEISENEDRDRQTRLRSAIKTATEFVSHFRYADAIRTLDNAIEPSVSDDSTEQLATFAAELRVGFIKRRQNFLIRAYLGITGLLSIAIIGALYFSEVNSVEIVADLKTQGFFAQIDKDSNVSIDELSGLVLSNFDKVICFADSVEIVNGTHTRNSLQPSESEIVRLNPNIGSEFKIHGETGGIMVESESLSVKQLKLSANHYLELSVGAENTPSVTLRHDATVGGAIVHIDDSVLIDCGRCSLEQAGKVIANNIAVAKIRPTPRYLKVIGRIIPHDYTFLKTPDTTAAQSVPTIEGLIGISAIDFTANTSGELVSLIKGGRVEIVEIDGRTVDISKSEFVDLGEVSDLYIAAILLGKSLELKLRGRVNTFKTGFGHHYLHSRMPSRLEWLLNNELVTLFFSSVSALFAFLIAVIIKFRLIEKI